MADQQRQAAKDEEEEDAKEEVWADEEEDHGHSWGVAEVFYQDGETEGEGGDGDASCWNYGHDSKAEDSH